MRNVGKYLAGVTIVGLACESVSAGIVIWDGGVEAAGTNTSWNVATNWSSNVLPAPADTAVFSNAGLIDGEVITLGASQTVSTLGFTTNVTGLNYAIGSSGESLTLTNVIRSDAAAKGTQTIAANIVLAADGVWNIANGTNGGVAATGAISGAGRKLTKIGNGTLTLSAANSYSGPTAVGGGTLALNFGAAGSPTGDIISSGSALVLNGGTLSSLGNSVVANSQAFAATTFDPGSSGLSIINGSASGSVLVSLGAIARNTASTVNFIQPTVNPAVSATNGYTTSTPNTIAGILGAYATVGGTDWASNNGTNIVAYTGYTTLTGAAPTLASDPVGNIRISNASTGPVGQAAGTTTVNTLLNNNVTARTLTVGTGNTLRLGAVGGILTAPGTGVLTIGASGTAGTLTAGGTDNTAGELLINNATAVTVNSVIANNGTGAVSLTKAGTGTLTLSGDNTFTGDTRVLSGAVNAGAGAIDGNLFVGSSAGSAPATFTGTSATAIGNSRSVTVYGNGTFVNSNAQNIANLTVNGGTASLVALYVNGPITMTGGVISGTMYGGHSAVTTLATHTTALISAGNNAGGAGQTFNVARGTAPLDLKVTGPMNIAFGSLSKTGAGVMSITSSSATGNPAFSITGGTLLVNNTTGSATGKTAVSVSGDATLGGTGIIGGVSGYTAANVALTGTSGHLATLSPGTIDEVTGSHVLGTLTVGGAAQSNDVTLNNHSRLLATVGLSGAADKLAVSGNLNLASVSNLDRLEMTTADGVTLEALASDGGTWVLSTFTNTLTGRFDAITLNGASLPAGLQVRYLDSSSNIVEGTAPITGGGSIVLVPEPALAGVMGLGMFLALNRRRNRPA